MSRREFSKEVRREALESYGPKPTDTRGYRVWMNMKSRCNIPSSNNYANYGGRGIRICPEWANSFETFIQDMGPRPSPLHSLDRIDSDGDYEPSNCRWATRKEQQRNIESNHFVRVNGVVMTLAEAAEGAPVNYNTVLYRLKRGWRIKDAITLPPQRGRKP